MKPASFTASFSDPKTELSQISDAYCDETEERGWVISSSPYALLQKSLFPNAESAEANAPLYFEKINAEAGRIDEVELLLLADLLAAETLLSDVNATARDALDVRDDISRRDVADFEEALVAARKSQKSFQEAQSILKERGAASRVDIADASREFEAEIETSRQLADALVSSWQAESDVTS
ncbi:MAG: hypothetical protein CMK07_01280 [Ponticaulis sp.]|nr:hypothetical protein [Ponticaulis sp.]